MHCTTAAVERTTIAELEVVAKLDVIFHTEWTAIAPPMHARLNGGIEEIGTYT